MTERGLYSVISNIHTGYHTNKLHNIFKLLNLGSCLHTVTQKEGILNTYRTVREFGPKVNKKCHLENQLHRCHFRDDDDDDNNNNNNNNNNGTSHNIALCTRLPLFFVVVYGAFLYISLIYTLA
jgi:hypothetical protein